VESLGVVAFSLGSGIHLSPQFRHLARIDQSDPCVHCNAKPPDVIIPSRPSSFSQIDRNTVGDRVVGSHWQSLGAVGSRLQSLVESLAESLGVVACRLSTCP